MHVNTRDLLAADTSLGNAGEWQQRHNSGLCNAEYAKTSEGAWVRSFAAWAEYAEAYEKDFNRKIGDDGFAGPIWEDQGRQLDQLLNMDMGKLDCGTLSKALHNYAKTQNANLD